MADQIIIKRDETSFIVVCDVKRISPIPFSRRAPTITKARAVARAERDRFMRQSGTTTTIVEEIE